MAWGQFAMMAAQAVSSSTKKKATGGTRVGFHRRRKALTTSDMKEALTIASAISKKAAENFILIRARS